MDVRGPLHRIEDALAEGSVDAWVEETLEELERYLAKHSAFRAFLDDASAA